MSTHPLNVLELACDGVRGLTPYEPGKPIAELERELGIRDAIKLASNENPLGPSPRALEAVQACLAELARYPDGNGFALKRALAERHGVEAACITLGNGSNDVLDLVARTFLGPGRSAVFSRHAFAVYPIATQAVGATARVAQANRPDDSMPYGHDLGRLAAAVGEDTRVVFIANPNNPTGTWLRSGELEAFITALARDVIVVVDEAYFEYVDDPAYPDTTQWLDRFPNLVVTRTFSKAYGLAGLRVGYSVSSPAIADLLNRVRQPFNLNIPAQEAALAALGDEDHLSRSVALNRAGRSQWHLGLAALGLTALPSVGNFLCVGVNRPGTEVYRALLDRGVIVRPVGGYGLPEFLRVTVGTEAENARALGALGDALAEIASH